MKTAFALCLFLFSASALLAGDKKIDQNVIDAFTNSMAAYQKTGGSDVRVVIFLADEGVNFETAGVDEAGREAVSGAVLTAQSRFMAGLQAEGLLADGVSETGGDAPVQIELLLDYQYALAATVTDLETVEKLAARADVARIEMDKLNQLFTVEGRALSGSTAAAASGYRGQGIGVAVIDSQYDLLHPELGGSTSMPNGIVYDAQNFSNPGTSPHSQSFNNCYHGTGTASIVRRYAPDSHLYALVVFPNAYDSVIANAINWCITNKNGSNGGAPIKVISMSLGGGQYSGTCNTGAVHSAAGSALSNGILVLAASGNNGWGSSTGSPSCSDNVISIGSVWDENGAAYSPFPPAYCSDSNRQADERACYSNTSSVLDLYAPSEEVICAQCGGGTWALGGTSSACPAAAGMVAQLLSYDGSYAGNKSSVVSLFQSTGATVIGNTSKRRIDIQAATGGGGGGPTGCSGTQYSGSLSGSGDDEYEPNGTYYYSSSSGSHTATLNGAAGTDFDLYLWKWNGSGWSTVASSLSASSTETINYSGSSGYYVWRVYSYSGSGSYTLCTTRP